LLSGKQADKPDNVETDPKKTLHFAVAWPGTWQATPSLSQMVRSTCAKSGDREQTTTAATHSLAGTILLDLKAGVNKPDIRGEANCARQGWEM